MKVTGFSFIRNALIYDYPVVEAIRSILPLCDEVVVAVGRSDDETLELVQSIDPQKVRILETVWDDSLRSGGRVLAEETNKAFQAISADSDWAFYIQGDECIHEKYHPAILAGMHKYLDNPQVDGLLFDYLHFYGSYDYVGESYRWYRKEIRIVRNDKRIYSYRDAQGFRKGENEKLSVKPIDACVYHYGWVRDPRAMQRKKEGVSRFWHDDEWIERHVEKAEAFDYSEIDALARFEGTHPDVMSERLRRMNWTFDYDISFNRFGWKDRFKRFIETKTGYRIGEYRNYRVLKE